ncbi:glycosyltransferase [Rivularia sp. UHCC 0363]|uniref:glycosyltransferase n=1 Tax=Rivularia sp. UHCC 0363 TaxID=3110244 RepID=UPI002B1EE94A|nr:glycosyltransferase [Rivularia sp. UHCC 0363]MEA5598790.1 glycosyltransferase [Rivularia sp. UHCC 0363]
MKIAFLAPANSIHTLRWVNALAERGHNVHLITQNQAIDIIHNNVIVHQLPFRYLPGYFLNTFSLKRILKNISPQLLHVHYASGYGTLGRLSGFHSLILSVWGSDVYDFPNNSPVHKNIVKNNLLAADWVCSTSEAMAKQTRNICPELKNLSITPFGIDVDKFISNYEYKNSNYITIGTIKTLAPKYGIDILIKAFAQVHKELKNTFPEIANKLRLLIVGGGQDQIKLELLVKELGIAEFTEFTGRVSHIEVPKYINHLDIYVAVSRLDSESFGVAVIEASACALPVIVSNVGGLPEVVQNEITGIVVERENIQATADAIIRLIKEPILRKKMGTAGRQYVLENYEWNENVTRMEKVYEQVLYS